MSVSNLLQALIAVNSHALILMTVINFVMSAVLVYCKWTLDVNEIDEDDFCSKILLIFC